MNDKKILFSKNVRPEVALAVYSADAVWYLTEAVQGLLSEDPNDVDLESWSAELDNALGPVRYWMREVLRHHGCRSPNRQQEHGKAGEPQASVASSDDDRVALPGAHVGPEGEESPFPAQEPKEPTRFRRRGSKGGR